MSDMARIQLEANEPETLLSEPSEVFVRVAKSAAETGWWPVVELLGPRDALLEFVLDRWGEEQADLARQEIDGYAEMGIPDERLQVAPYEPPPGEEDEPVIHVIVFDDQGVSHGTLNGDDTVTPGEPVVLDADAQSALAEELPHETCECGTWPIEEYGRVCPSCALEIARSAADAYMAGAYGRSSWEVIAADLLVAGHSSAETDAILRSKHMRWADDEFGAGAGNPTDSVAFRCYYAARRDETSVFNTPAYPRGFWGAEAQALMDDSFEPTYVDEEEES